MKQHREGEGEGIGGESETLVSFGLWGCSEVLELRVGKLQETRLGLASNIVEVKNGILLLLAYASMAILVSL